MAEASSDPALAAALRGRVGDPRRRELTVRLEADGSMLRVPVDATLDQLMGPLYHRALIIEAGARHLTRATAPAATAAPPIAPRRKNSRRATRDF